MTNILNNKEELESLMRNLNDEWNLIYSPYIEKEFIFENFEEALTFTNQIGEIADEVGHHPDVNLEWAKVNLKIFTHDAGGLTEKDFQLASKIDAIDYGEDYQETLNILIELLKSEDDFERRKAATKLGNIGDKKAVRPLIKALKDKDRQVPSRAASALGKIGDERAINHLIKLLRSDDFSGAAERALIRIGKPSIEFLLPYLNDKKIEKKVKEILIIIATK